MLLLRRLASAPRGTHARALAISAAELNARMRAGGLPRLLGARIDALCAESGAVDASLVLRDELLAPNGYCHAGTVVSLADTVCGAATYARLPPNAKNFTTVELKANLVATALTGTLTCRATLLHAGRSTQVWDAQVKAPCGKPMAYFRCTQMILY